MFRRRAHDKPTGEILAIGAPLTADLDARLGDALAQGRALADAARHIRNQHQYQHWSDAVLKWRTATADTLQAGFATTAARDALLEIWPSSAPLCATWPDWLTTERANLNASLDFADRVHNATQEFTGPAA